MHEGIVRLKLFFKVYEKEGLLMVISLVVSLLGILSLGFAFRTSTQKANTQIDEVAVQVPTISPTRTPRKIEESVTVDISGAVKNPHTYVLTKGSRLAEAVELAGGLSYNADTDYFYRNYNNARVLIDQEKIYVPRMDETVSGVFVEDRYYIEQGSPTTVKDISTNPSAPVGSGLLTINSATQAQIEDLPGIGPVSAEKIIQNRPYSSYEDLLTRSGLSEAVISKFQDQISYAQS